MNLEFQQQNEDDYDSEEDDVIAKQNEAAAAKYGQMHALAQQKKDEDVSAQTHNA